ncbi:DUF2845 domain-containing protein [Pseudomonas asturiensis]
MPFYRQAVRRGDRQAIVAHRCGQPVRYRQRAHAARDRRPPESLIHAQK